MNPAEMAQMHPITAPLVLIDDNPFQTRLSYDPEKIAALAAS